MTLHDRRRNSPIEHARDVNRGMSSGQAPKLCDIIISPTPVHAKIKKTTNELFPMKLFEMLAERVHAVASLERNTACASCMSEAIALGSLSMKTVLLIAFTVMASCSFSFAQSAGGVAAGGSSAGAASGAASGGATGGVTLSNGSTISGTGGGPGANTSNALNHGTTGNTLGATNAPITTPPGAASTGNSVNTPSANQAQQNLGNTETGILKK